jgi:peptidoglycan pentaglycine glycine transferase (the first glycine)
MRTPGLTAWLARDANEWDAAVERAPYRSFSQLWAWGELRRSGGWTPLRLAVGHRGDAGGGERIVAGVQLLVRRLPLLRTGFAYAPRGPFGDLDDAAVWDALLAAIGRLAARERLATVRLEPEVPGDSAVGRRLATPRFRSAPAVQPVVTRILDLAIDEASLLAGMRRKHRQYIGKAQRDGVTVEALGSGLPAEVLEPALADFHRIVAGTARRVGFHARPIDYYREVWGRLAPDGRVRLYFAARGGERLATLFVITCGDRAAELYGGSTEDGARRHANYLVKWGAIRALRAEGFTTYDLWGQPTGGIAQFKEGFGGNLVGLAGAHDLVVSRAGDVAVRGALAARERITGASRGEPRDGGDHAGERDDGAGSRDGRPAGSGARFRPATDADAAAWQALLERLPWGDVLHDWAWGPVAAFDGQPQRRFVLEEDGGIVALCAAQVRRTRFGRSFWYVPRGPVLDYEDPRAPLRLRQVIEGLRPAARADRAIAVRIEPRVERGSAAAALFDDAGLRRVPETLQTPDTRLVDLLPDDEALLATFDKDTRYAIRRSAREGVVTDVVDDPGDEAAVRALHGIVTETLARAGYRLPSLERYLLAWHGLAGAGRARIITARHEGSLESAGLLVIQGARSIYLYAGSIREGRGETKRFASYAVQWRMMQTARGLGARVHDLWGVAPADATPEHPWYGYSLFKKGFGGRFVAWAGSWDLVVDPLLYRLRGVTSALRPRRAA